MRERVAHDVGPAADVPPGARAIVEVGGRSVGVFNVGGRLHALQNLCPHGGAPLCLGSVGGMSVASEPGADIGWEREGEILRCPWHGWEFDLSSGGTVTEPRLHVQTFRAWVEDGRIWVAI